MCISVCPFRINSEGMNSQSIHGALPGLLHSWLFTLHTSASAISIGKDRFVTGILHTTAWVSTFKSLALTEQTRFLCHFTNYGVDLISAQFWCQMQGLDMFASRDSSKTPHPHHRIIQSHSAACLDPEMAWLLSPDKGRTRSRCCDQKSPSKSRIITDTTKQKAKME